jgi:hypothetical protein
MERTDWLDEGLNSADARFLMLTAITHHRFSSPIWGEHEVRKLHAELAELDLQVTQAAADRDATRSAWRRPSMRLSPCAAGRGTADGAPLVLGGPSPDARGDALVQCPGQARHPYRAGAADPFGLSYLAQRGPGRADREEQVGIAVKAGCIIPPVGIFHVHGTKAYAPLGEATSHGLGD